jgi:hypothetical protein
MSKVLPERRPGAITSSQ